MRGTLISLLGLLSGGAFGFMCGAGAFRLLDLVGLLHHGPHGYFGFMLTVGFGILLAIVGAACGARYTAGKVESGDTGSAVFAIAMMTMLAPLIYLLLAE